uniref:Uncharacterized protein n=1 Tax=Vitis vinifera TaxID=29760 RepID=A5AP16_VITVI|nr:hypothetical protein VITISV_033532 [Vitis vinifera]
MARTRGAKSSSLSSHKRAAPKTPVQGSTSEPPRPPRVPPPVEDAPMSHPVRRYQTRASSQPPKKKAKVSEPALIDLSEPEKPSLEPQPAQPQTTDSHIPSGMAPEMYHMEHLLTPRDFFYPRVAMDFYQSMTTHHVRNPTVIHFTIDGRHGILGARHIAEALRIPYEPASPEDYRVWTHPSQSEIVRILSREASTHQYLLRKELPPSMRGVLLEALFRISEGFFFGPHHLIMAALLYFEEKVHKKKLLRADAIPLLFPRLLCQILEHLGYPSEPQLERKRICREIFTLDKWTNMTAYSAEPGAPAGPIETPTGKRAPAPTVPSTEPIPEVAPSASPATPRLPPVIPATSEPSSSFEPRTTISIFEYRALCHTLQALTTSQSILTQEMTALRAHQEQVIATQTQHTAILRQIQHHLGIPSAPEHQMRPLRAHRADCRRHRDIHLSHYLHIIILHPSDHFHSLLYIKKSTIQYFKRFTNRSSNEEVRAIGSRSLQAEGQFRRAAKSAFGCEMISQPSCFSAKFRSHFVRLRNSPECFQIFATDFF